VSTPSLKVIVAVTSPIAFENLGNKTILNASFNVARAFTVETGIKTQLAIAVDNKEHANGFDCEVLICDPNNPASLAAAIKASTPTDLVAIHDSQRPLTRTTQFHRAIEALIGDVDAVRPVSEFTETLKAINGDATIERTIDRTSMQRVSTPEVIRFSAIDFVAKESTWFIPLKSDAKISTVDADPESLRVNSLTEITLMESFVHWQQTVAIK
jgi:2-C-methyl-D-erythritol 4-phosphate cytidylyltransferase